MNISTEQNALTVIACVVAGIALVAIAICGTVNPTHDVVESDPPTSYALASVTHYADGSADIVYAGGAVHVSGAEVSYVAAPAGTPEEGYVVVEKSSTVKKNLWNIELRRDESVHYTVYQAEEERE